MQKNKVAYCYPRESSFVEKDIRLLSESFIVLKFNSRIMGPISLLSSVFRQLLFLITTRPDVYIVMFSGHHSLLVATWSKIRRRPCIIIAGGADCVSYPSLNYGNFRKKVLAFSTSKSFQLATAIAPVSSTLIYSKSSYFEPEMEQGILAFTSVDRGKFIPIANGYDSGIWNSHSEKRTTDFLTVATHVETNARRVIKGLDLFVELAFVFPERSFCIAGLLQDQFEDSVPTNIRFTGELNMDQLKEEYSTSKFYLQLSVSEGFPNALCEAMLCGCVPIVSQAGGMPEIIGGVGYVLEHKRKDQAALLLSRALSEYASKDLGASRERIASNFSEEKRRIELSALVLELINQKN